MCNATRTSLTNAGSSVHGSPRRQPACFRIVLCTVIACTLAGCLGARGDIETVEAQLRQQQDRADQYARQLSQTQDELNLARKEADLLRRQMTETGGQPLPAEFTESLFQVQALQINGLMSGGRDRDGQPGDEVLVAVLTPVDEHGDLVKLPGTIELEALDLTRPEGERQLGKWTFDAAQSRDLWKSGLFSAGYQVEVPWQQPPAEELMLHARLTTADGRHFDATHPVKVELPGQAPPRTLEKPSGVRPVSHNDRAGSPWDDLPDDPSVRTAGLEETLEMSERGVPRPDDELPLNGETPAAPQPSDDAFTTVRKPAAIPAKPDTTAPHPFPEGLQTSDVFTDETIPYRR
jgi:hypothetical protein